jgi:cyanobactin maturation PatA/PatG family protease
MSNKITGLEELRKFGNGDPNIKIAVLDGPVDLKHECFNQQTSTKLQQEVGAIHPSSLLGLAAKHGTAVYSLIFGKPGSPVEGIAPGCSGLVIPIYSQHENGGFSSASQVVLARAIELAIEQGAHIINISGGQFSKTGDPDLFLKQAIEKCYKAGILIVAASGNDGCSCLHVPAADKQVFAVGSMDEDGIPTKQTNYGHSYLLNGILAPGKNLTAARAGGGTFQTNGGTSYATPVVSGVVALLMSLQIKSGGSADAYAVRDVLEKTAIRCVNDGTNDCRRFMLGKLNIPAALKAIREHIGFIAAPGIVFPLSQNNIIMSPNFINAANEKELFGGMIQEVIPASSKDEAGFNCIVRLPENYHTDNKPETTEPEDVEEQMNETPTMEKDDSLAGARAISLLTPQSNGDESNITDEHNPLTNFNILKPENMEQKDNMGNVMNSKGVEKNGQRLFPSAAAQTTSKEIDPSDCGCGCGGGGETPPPPAIVYALGTIGYDFGSESHRDSFVQSMQSIGDGNPHNPKDLLAYLGSAQQLSL